MTTTTTNVYIRPDDGWTQIAASASKFLRVSSVPHTHPYYLYFGSSAPSLLRLGASGTATFSGGIPSDAQTIVVGSETYTFKTSPAAAFDVQIAPATPGVGTVTFSGGVPTAAQTLVIGSETYTFVASASSPFEVTIGATATLTADNFVTTVTANSTLITAANVSGVVTVTSILNTSAGNYAYNTSATHVAVTGTAMTGGQDGSLLTATNFTSSVNTNSTLVTAVDSGGVVTLSSTLFGSAGNYAFTKTATHVAISGSGTLTGGTDISEGILMCHKSFWCNITTDQPLWARVASPTASSNRNDGRLRLDVVRIA